MLVTSIADNSIFDLSRIIRHFGAYQFVLRQFTLFRCDETLVSSELEAKK